MRPFLLFVQERSERDVEVEGTSHRSHWDFPPWPLRRLRAPFSSDALLDLLEAIEDCQANELHKGVEVHLCFVS